MGGQHRRHGIKELGAARAAAREDFDPQAMTALLGPQHRPPCPAECDRLRWRRFGTNRRRRRLQQVTDDIGGAHRRFATGNRSTLGFRKVVSRDQQALGRRADLEGRRQLLGVLNLELTRIGEARNHACGQARQLEQSAEPRRGDMESCRHLGLLTAIEQVERLTIIAGALEVG